MKRKFNIDARYYFDVEIEIDEENPEFKEIMESYTSTISKNGDIESLLEYIVHNYIYYGSYFVEGVGNIYEIEEKGAIKILHESEENEYSVEENEESAD